MPSKKTAYANRRAAFNAPGGFSVNAPMVVRVPRSPPHKPATRLQKLRQVPAGLLKVAKALFSGDELPHSRNVRYRKKRANMKAHINAQGVPNQMQVNGGPRKANATAYMSGTKPWVTHKGAFKPSSNIVVRVPRSPTKPNNTSRINALKKMAANIYLNMKRTYTGEFPANRVQRIRAKTAYLKNKVNKNLVEEEVIKLMNMMAGAGTLVNMRNKHHRKQVAPYRAPVN